MNDENKDGVNLTPEQIKAIIAERDELAQAKASLTTDLLSEKKKKQDAEDKLKNLPPVLPTDTKKVPETDIEKIIEAKLRERDEEDIKIAQDEAWKDFVKNNKEFDPSSDKEGLRKAALESTLKNFNFSGARKKDDFMEKLNDAALLLSKKESLSTSDNPYASQPSNSGKVPVLNKDASLTSQERATMSRLGWTVEKFMEQKLKHPEMFQTVFGQ